MNDQELSVVAEKLATDVTVLRIATAAKNSVTQLYPKRPQVFLQRLEELHKKIIRKLDLHQIFNVSVSVCVQLENDRIINLSSMKDLLDYDFEISSLTDSISLRWSFVFDPDEEYEQHLHSIFLKISETPSASIFLQKMLSSRTDDLETPDGDIFSPIFCKVDFAENRFSSEVMALVTEWVNAQPYIEESLGFMLTLRRYRESISSFVVYSLPPLAVLAFVGIWLGYVPQSITDSTKYAAAWVLIGGAFFLLARYAALYISKKFEQHVRRITIAPLFQITAGDKNRMTKYLARSYRSVISLAMGAIIYGSFKTLGIYLASLIITSFSYR